MRTLIESSVAWTQTLVVVLVVASYFDVAAAGYLMLAAFVLLLQTLLLLEMRVHSAGAYSSTQLTWRTVAAGCAWGSFNGGVLLFGLLINPLLEDVNLYERLGTTAFVVLGLLALGIPAMLVKVLES